MVKVSVIIPAYNGDRYLGAAIESIREQTYQDYEIIVIDDGSTDNTAQIVQQYGDSVQYLTQPNQGVAASRNRGLATAQGEYIAFLDQDDVFLPLKLGLQVALLEQEPSLGMVNSGWQITDQQGQIQAAVEPWKKIPNLTAADIIIWKPIFLGAMLFRRSWLDKIAGFNTTLEQTPDVDLVMRLAMKGCPAAWVEQTTVQYRQHQANASKNTLLQTQELNQITSSFFAQSNLAPELKALESESRYQSLVWGAWRLHQSGDLVDMRHYLHQSLACSQKYPTEIVLSWIESFKNYSAEYGLSSNIMQLTGSAEWQSLLQNSIL
ncbi:MAG: glycosyltransferase family A protein [Cyanobacteria bacterium J06621_8]